MNSGFTEDPHQLERALNLLVEGQLSEEEARTLQERMKSDPALLAKYLGIVRMDSLLRDFGWRREDEPVVAPLQGAQKTHRTRWLLLAAVAAMVAVIPLVSLWRSPHLDTPAVATLPSVKFSPTSVFETVGPQSTDDGQLRFGDAVAMSDGSVSIRLPSGVEAVIKSPARFAITGQNRIQLDKGIAWFRVPQPAKGFAVDLPWMEVVDLGTVFTTQVSEESHEVRVDQGHVEVRVKNPSGAQAPIALVGGQTLVQQSRDTAPQVQSTSNATTSHVQDEEAKVVFKEMLKHVPDQSFAERQPLVGSWTIREGFAGIRNGRFSADSDFTHLMGEFSEPVEKDSNAIVILSFKSVSPTSLFHSKGFAGVSLFDHEGEMFFIGDRSTDTYSWELVTYGKNFRGPMDMRTAYSLSTQGSEATFTLRYRQRTGEFDVFKGWGVEGLPLLKGKTDPNMRINRVRIANGKGGDFSFENIQVSVVHEKVAE